LYQGVAQQQFRQHPAHLPQQHQYHAAAMASNRPAAAAAQPGLQQLLHQHDQQHSNHWQQQLDQHAVAAQQQVGLADAATPSSTSSSSASSAGGGISSLPAVSPISSAEGSGLAGEDEPFNDVLGLSSFQQQYQATLQHLHVGHTRNLSQLAQLFDPAAVLAGERVRRGSN
jgi:O6-methylguanine-DNA--protein-cysteine methyltransferase